MTVELLKKISKTDTDDLEELYILAKNLYENRQIEPSVYATLKSNINRLNPEKTAKKITKKSIHKYSEDEILAVIKSHLDVYDGKKPIQAHLTLMKQMFGENSSQFRNGEQYNKGFHRTVDYGNPNLGQSMPANWADATLKLLQDRPDKMKNVLEACKIIYKETNNGNMYKVIQKWSIR
jgi:hypothetical protein